MNEYCENLISNGVPSWIVEEAYKFTIEPLKSTEGYSYRFKGGDIFLRLVKAEGSYELRNPIGYGVQVVKCKDLDEADTKAKEVLEAFFEDKVNIKVI